MRTAVLVSCLLGCFSASLFGSEPLTVCQRLSALADGDAPPAGDFELTATVLAYNTRSATLGLMDASGFATISYDGPLSSSIRPGDRVRTRGNVITLEAASLEILSRGTAVPPEKIAVTDINSGQVDHRLVEVVGLVRDIYPDEVNPLYSYLTVQDDTGIAYVAFRKDDPVRIDETSLVGASVSLTGLCIPIRRTASKRSVGDRQRIGRTLQILDNRDIRTLRAAPADPFLVPELVETGLIQPADFVKFGRRRMRGRVLAVWKPNAALLDAGDHGISKIEFAGAALPARGDDIEVVGFPETDVYHVNLTRARWRRCGIAADRSPERPIRLTARTLMTDAKGKTRIQHAYNGRNISLRGIIRSLPCEPSPDARIYIETDGYLIAVDISALNKRPQDLTVGMTIEVVGTCVMDIENWRPNAVFPQIKGFFIVPPVAEDIRVVARPPWWTPARFCALIGLLVGVLAAVFVWNLSLRTLVKRRARQLFRADLARATSELRVQDRTRLAVELHDSLSQSLTAVSMEVEAAIRHGDADRENMARHLKIADKVLKSCRNDLRNSLWDLRNDALEERDTSEAIRRTLLPHARDVKLQIDFSVPRSRLTDSTLHEILCIIRELAVNGISHGKATEIRIAGSVVDGILRFSVTDNGSGFDTANVPGVRQGHFGLQGVRERLRQLHGALAFERERPNGIRASVSIPLAEGEKS